MCVPKLRETILDQLEDDEGFQLHLRLLREANDEEDSEEETSDFDDVEVLTPRTPNWYTPDLRDFRWFPNITLEQYNRARGVVQETDCPMYQEFRAIIEWNENIFEDSSKEYDEYLSILIE